MSTTTKLIVVAGRLVTSIGPHYRGGSNWVCHYSKKVFRDYSVFFVVVRDHHHAICSIEKVIFRLSYHTFSFGPHLS
jgi:hypothetical protein